MCMSLLHHMAHWCVFGGGFLKIGFTFSKKKYEMSPDLFFKNQEKDRDTHRGKHFKYMKYAVPAKLLYCDFAVCCGICGHRLNQLQCLSQHSLADFKWAQPKDYMRVRCRGRRAELNVQRSVLINRIVMDTPKEACQNIFNLYQDDDVDNEDVDDDAGNQFCIVGSEKHWLFFSGPGLLGKI